ncbi:MAG: 50S ribosomal protein L30 [Nitrososphaerota archaeon]
MDVSLNTFLAVRVRGSVGASKEVLSTLRMLNLPRANYATIVRNTSSSLGMLRKVQRYVTWGEPTLETVKRLLVKKGELDGGKRLDDERVKALGFNSIDELAEKIFSGEVTLSQLKEKGLRPFFRLHPPRKGFKHSIKRPFKDKGEFGYRGQEINSLAVRMS